MHPETNRSCRRRRDRLQSLDSIPSTNRIMPTDISIDIDTGITAGNRSARTGPYGHFPPPHGCETTAHESFYCIKPSETHVSCTADQKKSTGTGKVFLAFATNDASSKATNTKLSWPFFPAGPVRSVIITPLPSGWFQTYRNTYPCPGNAA